MRPQECETKKADGVPVFLTEPVVMQWAFGVGCGSLSLLLLHNDDSKSGWSAHRSSGLPSTYFIDLHVQFLEVTLIQNLEEVGLYIFPTHIF